MSLFLLPSLAACSFLLDFDELQSGPAAGVGGSGGTAGTGEGGAAGEGGEAGGCGVCDDGDPCTIDVCGADGECTNTFTEGLGLEVDQVYFSDYFVRTTMTSGADAFFISALEVTNATDETTDLSLYRLGIADGDQPQLMMRTSELNRGQAVSAAGLAIDTNIGTRLHAFAALKLGQQPARVVHVVFDDNQQRIGNPEGIGSVDYPEGNPFLYPPARTIGSKVYTAFPNLDGTISVATPAPLIGFEVVPYGDALLPANSVSLLGATDDTPAVLFTSNGNGVYMETSLKSRVQLDECQPLAGGYTSSSVATAGNGIWLASWTKFADDVLTSETKVGACADQCMAVAECGMNDANNLIRNPAAALEHLPGDPADLVHLVSALPALVPITADTLDAVLLIQLAKTDFAEDSQVSGNIGAPLGVARMPARADLRGPDYPSIGIVPGAPNHRVGVAWVQPGPMDGAPDELHIQRYRMCLPP